MSNGGSLTLDDFLVSLSNAQGENFSRMWELMRINLEKLKRMESLMNEIKVKVEKLETAISANADKDKEPVPQESFEKQYENPFVVKLEKMDKENVDASNFLPRPEVIGEKADKVSRTLKDIFCFDCKITFVRGSGEFTRHVKETRCKPYQCHCGKLFKKKSSLTAHKSTHSTANFSCHCGSVFRCEQYLKNHKRRQRCEKVPDNHEGIATKKYRLSKSPSSNAVPNEEWLMDHFSMDPMNYLQLQLQEE